MVHKATAMLTTVLILATLVMPSISASPLELEGRIVILDAGHGEATTNRYAGYDEQVTMLKLALKIKPLLESRGATVYMARPADETIPLPVRAAMINTIALDELRDARLSEQSQWYDATEDLAEIARLRDIMQSIIIDTEAYGHIYMNSPFKPERKIHPELIKVFELQNDPVISSRFLVISLHSNATAWPINTGVNGASAYYISSEHHNASNYYTGHSYVEQSRHFGEILLGFIEGAGIRKREVKFANYFIIREHNVPGVLVENGFHTNDRDRANLQNDEFLDGLAFAYLEAITAYFRDLPLHMSKPRLPYSDVHSGAWYYDAVEYVTLQRLFEGTGSGMFTPDAPMTRSMLVVLLANLANVDLSHYTYSPYTDVSIDAWYGKAAAWAAENGLLGYISGRDFKPGQSATREETALIIYHYLLISGMAPAIVSTMIFSDDASISQWAKSAVHALRGYGVIRGDNDNRYNPQNSITRAEAAQILTNVYMQLSNG